MDAFKLLQDDLLLEDNYSVNVNTIKKIQLVAKAIGPARVKTQLLPFISDFLEQYDHDECHALIANDLGVFIKEGYLQTSKDLTCTLPILSKLAGKEELVVRQNAVQSITLMLPKLSEQDLMGKLVPVLKRLANGDWFTTRVSACSLFAPLYPLVKGDAALNELRSLYVNLCNDDTPMVRKAASLNLGDFCIQLSKEDFKMEFFDVLKAFSTDDMEVMRMSTVGVCYQVAKTMEPSEFVAQLLPLVEAVCDDHSWRVRKTMAVAIPDMIGVLSEQVVTRRLLPLLSKLVQDAEAEVRIAAVHSVGGVAKALTFNKVLATTFTPHVKELVKDPVAQVRIAFSRQLAFLLPCYANESDTAVSRLVPAIKALSKDECVNVRWSVMEGLFPVGLLEVKAMNSLTVSSDTSLVDMFRELKITKQSFFTTPKFTTLINDVLPVIAELSRDRAWRVRLSVITKSTMLLSLLGLKTWEKYFKNVLIGALSDHVFTVRECACTQVGSIVAAAGAEWAAEKFFPTAFSIYDKGNNYLHRMTCLRMIMKLNSEEKVESSIVQTKLYPIVSQAVDDDVANVKINAAKCLALMVPRVNAALLKKIKPQLRKLSQDEDDDVAYFAQQALDDHAQYFKK